MFWPRKSAPVVHERSRVVGLDLTASRVRGVSAGSGQIRPLVLDEPDEDLLLYVAGDRRTPDVGRVGYALARRLPHAVCSDFLPFLHRDRDWKAGRHTLTADAALALAFEKVARVVNRESEAVALAVPAYLDAGQVGRAVVAGTRAKLPLKGTTIAPLALAAARAGVLLAARPTISPAPKPGKEGVVPMRPPAAGPGSVAVVDADEHALSVTVVAATRDEARLVRFWHTPRLGTRAWKDRLLDCIADRCIRLCRRDPRDSADAEQALFEQLDDAMERARAGQKVCLTVRTAHWYQDVVQQPDELGAYCSALARAAADGVREVIGGAGLAVPPRAVWLTGDAARLPGLALAVHQNTPEGTAVEILPSAAVAHAAAALVPRWLTGELPRTHLDTAIPIDRSLIPPAPARNPTAPPGTAGGRK